ncbi:MAG: hypothetical protein EOM26_08545 [Alphaproteobacteria bacterium]|nr:hypothetical protein [Alphaproteobacteria bacterium]
MVDRTDDGEDIEAKDRLIPLNVKRNRERTTAVAIKDSAGRQHLPTIAAAGRGALAEQILRIAFDNDIKVREDSALAEMLATIELDSPIPSEAFMAVAEILQYVYRANGKPNPFDVVLKNEQDEPNQKQEE